MAYDASSTYVAPRRAYYGQPQQQAPVQNGYGNPAEEQYEQYSNPYMEQPYGQGYSGYEQQYSSNNGYNSAQPNGYQVQQQGSERQYDPRYQQRSERGRQPSIEQQGMKQGQQPGYNQQKTERGREPRQDQYGSVMAQPATYEQAPNPKSKLQKPPPESQYQMQQARPNPRNARNYGGPQPQTQDFHPQSAGLPAPPRIGDPVRPQSAPGSQQNQHDPSKMSMQEWKAKEKARMHAEAALPDTIAQDNAFPVFPTTRERSRVRNSGSVSPRRSGDLQRPPPTSEIRHERKSSKARTYSDSMPPNPPDSPQQMQQYSRPPLNYNPYSFDELEDRSMPALGPPSTQPQFEPAPFRHELSASPLQTRGQQGRLQQEFNQPAAPAQSEWAQSSAQSNGLVQNYQGQFHNTSPEPSHPNQRRQPSPAELSAQVRTPPPQAGSVGQQYGQHGPQAYQNQSMANRDPQPQPRQPFQQVAAPPPIDTRLAQPQPKPALIDHQPLSPGPVAPRPSTSQGQRPPLSQSAVVPMSASLQSQMPQHFNRAGAADLPKTWAQQQFDQENPYGTFGPYDDPRAPTQVAAPPRTREEEIEADMPDFDSAAPGGTSLLHKRGKGYNEPPKSAPPPMPAMSPQDMYAGGRGYQGQEQRSYNQQSSQMPPSDQRVPNDRQAGPTDKYVYGVPGQNNPRKYGASYNQIPPDQAYQQPPPQPPFANEQPRRSLDDARQMPYRQGPPAPQRSQTSGPEPPSSSRQHRSKPQSENNRNHGDLSVQTAWSGPPPSKNVGSAPPTQQNFRDPHLRQGNGPSATRELSDPARPMPGQRRSDPDSLPQHPTPVRPGHMERGPGQPAKPPPVRSHTTVPPASHQRQVSSSNTPSTRPVTAAELKQLQAAVDAQPQDQKRTMLLIKKLVEASTVLASDGGRADARTQAKNSEKYIMEADKRLRKLVSTGNPDAQFFLADCYGQGSMGLPINPKEAFGLYQAAAKAGHGQAAYRTAMCCELGPEDGGTSKDYGKAVQWYRRGAALGDPDAMFKIGIILLKGLLGQPRNIGEAVNFLKRAVEQSGQNNPQALYELAQLYESGHTNPEVRNKVIPDDKYALDLFHQAAAAGQRNAQFRLGQAYEYGNIGAPIDNRASITWYTKAAAQGEHQAELALSGWYLTGAAGILQQSDTEAYLWARKAAASDPPLPKAMFALGYFTETGIGCPQSMEEAKKWYARAANQRFPKALERLEEIRRSGSKVSRPVNGKLNRNDQKKDEENCVVM